MIWDAITILILGHCMGYLDRRFDWFFPLSFTLFVFWIATLDALAPDRPPSDQSLLTTIVMIALLAVGWYLGGRSAKKRHAEVRYSRR